MKIETKLCPLEGEQGKCWRRTTDDARRTYDGHSVIIIAHLEHFLLKWAKNGGMSIKYIKKSP